MKNVIVLRPKTIEVAGFLYNGIEDLPNLIKFIGRPPVIQFDTKGEPEISFKKVIVKPDTLVLRNGYGEVTGTLTSQEISAKFDIVTESEFTSDHINKVSERVKVVKEKTKSTGKK